MKKYAVKCGEQFLTEVKQPTKWATTVSFGEKDNALLYDLKDEAVKMAARLNNSETTRLKARVIIVR